MRLVTENIEDQALIDATEEACAYSRAMRCENFDAALPMLTAAAQGRRQGYR